MLIGHVITPGVRPRPRPPVPFGGGDYTSILPMVAIFVVFYFLLIRPQQKKAKEHRAMLESLEKGNEVVTAGGIVGRIMRLHDPYVTLEIAPGTEVTVQRQAVTQLLPKGTLKSLTVPPTAPSRLPAPRETRGTSRPMNRYPLWKYVVIGIAARDGLVYTLPNFFPEVPAVQVSSSKAAVKIDSALLGTVEERAQGRVDPLPRRDPRPTGVKVRFDDPDTQLKAKDVLQAKLGANYIVALNLLSASPQWLRRSARCRCTSASTCAAACTSCCRST